MDKEKLRKIDELVAEKVMGFIPHKDDEREFSPSTDISDAWMVVDKLEESHYFFYIGHIVDKNNKKIYRAFFKNEHPITTLIHTYEADAKTAPLAVCLAALKAVGIEIEMEESNNE